MRLAIVGSRTWTDYRMVFKAIRSAANAYPALVVVSGYDDHALTPKGADEAAYQAARALDLSTKMFPADWEGLGKRAGFARNADIVNSCDKLVAFWDGSSKGARHSIKLALEQGKFECAILPDARRLYAINFEKGGW